MTRNLRHSFLLVAVMFNWTSSLACSCFSTISGPVEFLLSDDLVFAGKILSIVPITKERGSQEYLMATFLVDTWIAPKKYTDTVSVYTGINGALCGLDFQEGDTWIIYSYRGYAGICEPSMKRNEWNHKSFDRTLRDFRRMSHSNKYIHKSYENLVETYEISGQLRNGLPEGQWIKLQGKDTVFIFNFTKGKRQGLQKEFATNAVRGQMEIYESTANSVSIYDAKSKNLKEYWELKNGIRDGKYEIYYSGKLFRTGMYRNGRKEGEWFEWHKDKTVYAGVIKTVTTYDHDVLISEVWVDESGNEIKH